MSYHNNMAEFIKTIFPWLTLISNIIFALSILAFFYRESWGRGWIDWLNKHALKLGLLVVGLAMVGSLSYSNIVGYAPCLLCWWQRIFLYPQVVLFVIALRKRDPAIWSYVAWLSIIAAVISLYHVNLQWGGFSITPCAAAGPSCDKVYVKTFGYITIPLMALSTSVYILFLAYLRRKYENRNA